MAIDRIYKSQASTEAPLLPGFTVELFLMPCALRTTDDKDTTLAELGCSGSSSNPLNIFVVPMKTAFSDEDKPQDLWAFECSDRGIATFLTCLKVLLNQCRHTESANRRMLKTLFKTTHFPPAMEALHALKEDNRLIPYQVAILATCFRDMALRMVPSALIGNSFKCALQGSRQIFAWLEAENMTSSNEVDDPEAALVRTVGLEECSGTSVRGMSYQAGKRKEIVVLQGSGVASASSSSTDVRQVRSVTVTVHMTCQEDLRLLALALWGFYDEIENFYVDFRGNIDDPLKHRRTPGITNRQFFHLLKTANESNNYRLIAPKNLDETYGPAITLSADGYVSEFGTAYGEFKDQKKHTWNAISGTEILESEPGNNILEALKPIMKQRVQEGTWDVDDWNNTQLDAAESSIDTPQEAIVICFDLSYSMNDPLGDDWVGAPNDFTKLTETKQVFENVIGRMLGYQLVSNVVGVVTFSSSEKIKVTRKLSRINQQEFKDMVQDIRGRGQTALWDAIGKARDMLTAFKTVHANTKLRIIVLTDGINNDSINSPEDICTSLYEAEIVLDSIVIGECSTKDLFKLSKHTGGYAFNPQSRLLLFQTFLLEPFLDISARPDIERIPVDNYEISEPKLPDMRTLFDFPPLRKHQLEDGSFVSLNDAGCFFTSHSSTLVGQRNKGSVLASRIVPYRTPSIVSTSGLSASTLRSNGLQRTMSDMRSTSDRSSHSIGRVYLSEITQMLAVSHEQPYSSMDVYVNETNMSYWKVVMEGPKGTPYEKGTFVLSVSMSPSFPQIPPIVRFLTPILHPNVTKVSTLGSYNTVRYTANDFEAWSGMSSDIHQRLEVELSRIHRFAVYERPSKEPIS